MTPGNLLLPTIWRGCDWQEIFLKWKNPDGTPFNLNRWTPAAQTRTGVSLNPVVTDVLGGVTKISLPRTTTAEMKLGVEQWDWVWTYQDPDPMIDNVVYPPILSGQVTIAQSDTRTIPVAA